MASYPFLSAAQRLKWIQLVAEGKVTQAQFDAKDSATDKKASLPERTASRKRTVGASRSAAEAQFGKSRY